MWVWRTRLKHIFFNPNWKRKKSNKKHKKLINRYINLLKKESAEWLTKWIIETKKKCITRIKKYNINVDQINSTLKHKWLDNLFIKKIS